MNWKYLFFLSTACWISVLVLMQCTSPSAEAPATEKQVVSDVSNTQQVEVLNCPDVFNSQTGNQAGGYANTCQNVREEYQAYKNVITEVANRLKTLPKPAESSAIESKKVHVAGTQIPYDELIAELTLLQGFRFSKNEVATLLDSASTNDFYIMYTINPKPRQGSPIKYLDAYLVVKNEDQGHIIRSRGASSDDPDGDNTSMGDFPDPCPDSCP